MTIGRAALVTALLASPLGAAVTPFDFTGHWSGHVVQQGRTAPLEADLTGTGTFTGTLGTDIGGFITCSLQGTQKRKVAITATCSNGSTAKIRGKLEAATHTVTGRYRSRRNGRGLSGKFMLTSPGGCVPTGGDCTDPATGGGESSVCCNGDCTRAGTPGVDETHGCN